MLLECIPVCVQGITVLQLAEEVVVRREDGVLEFVGTVEPLVGEMALCLCCLVSLQEGV